MKLLRKVSSLAELNLHPGSIEKAVGEFVKDSHTEETGANPDGLFNQTIESIAAATTFATDKTKQFWAYTENGELLVYVLTHITKDVDNSLCYWITQAYVDKSLRSTPDVKRMYKQLQIEAKRLLCKHIIVPSSRGVEAYCRWLGKTWHPYVTLLKTDL